MNRWRKEGGIEGEKDIQKENEGTTYEDRKEEQKERGMRDRKMESNDEGKAEGEKAKADKDGGGRDIQ